VPAGPPWTSTSVPLARHEDDLVAGPGLGQRVAVLGDLVELVAVQAQPEGRRRGEVLDAPALGLARPDRHGRVQLAVDQPQVRRLRGGPLVDDAAAVGRQLRRLQDEHPLGHPVDAGQAVEVPLDDDPARHAGEHLVVRGAVQVRVVVVDAGGMVGRDLVLVLEALAGLDGEEDVVGVALGGDVEPVGVEVRVAGGRVLGTGGVAGSGQRGAQERVVRRQPRRQRLQVVDQVDPEEVAGADAQRRAGDGALVGPHDRRPPRHRHLHHARREGGVEQAVAAGADLGLGQRFALRGAAGVDPGQDQAPARHADGGDPGAGRQLEEVPAADRRPGVGAASGSAWCVRDERMGLVVHRMFPSGVARARAGTALDPSRNSGARQRRRGRHHQPRHSAIGGGTTTTVPPMPGWMAHS
jgi:hypothetical protein